jgi:uncharacterized repeat protein (TIGR03803 family)
MRSTVVRALLAAATLLALGYLPEAKAQTFQILYSFPGGLNGAGPTGSLVMDSSNNLLGTTTNGGDTGCGSYIGCGVVYKLSLSGAESTLTSFHKLPDAQYPLAGVIWNGGHYYGTTETGGTGGGFGTVFSVTPGGSRSILYSFQGSADGQLPFSGLTRDQSGSLYGTTEYGGSYTTCTTYGCGTVYKVDKNGNHTVLHAFTGLDGAYPFGGVIGDAAGNLYGTTQSGGSGPCTGGCGVVFKLDTAGNETVLYNFQGYPTDGVGPTTTLVTDPEGNFYGTTYGGGTDGEGTIFKLSPQGLLTTLHNFSARRDGGAPSMGVIRDSRGNLYGTTYFGGSTSCGLHEHGCGVVYRLTPTGQFIVLHLFVGGPSDGENPTWGNLLLDSSGNLYGVATSGGAYSSGVVFKITP